MNQIIFVDQEHIDLELKHVREEAAKIQNLLDLIGEVKTPSGMQTVKTGLRLVKDLLTRSNAVDYLAGVMVVKQGEKVLGDALEKIRCTSGKAMDLDLFTLNESGKVEGIGERRVKARNTYYLENDKQAEYIKKAEALAKAYNELETFLQEHKHPGLSSNMTFGYNTDRLLYSFVDPAKDYTCMEVNLRAIKDFK